MARRKSRQLPMTCYGKSLRVTVTEPPKVRSLAPSVQPSPKVVEQCIPCNVTVPKNPYKITISHLGVYVGFLDEFLEVRGSLSAKRILPIRLRRRP